jgi:hypothetical protein
VVHRLLQAFILGKLAGDQHPGPFETTQSGGMDTRLDRIDGIFGLAQGFSLQSSTVGIHLDNTPAIRSACKLSLALRPEFLVRHIYSYTLATSLRSANLRGGLPIFPAGSDLKTAAVIVSG